MPPVRIAPRNYFYWIGGALFVISVAARAVSYPIVTSDYTYFLSKWFDALKSHAGLTAFTTPFSDYAPLYLYFLKLLTFIPVSSLYSIKALSGLFDIALAAFAYMIVRRTAPQYSQSQLWFAAALIFALPTVVLNSSLWGQSDSVYAAGILLCLYCIVADEPLAAVLAFSFAFCIKLQAIFFLPVLVGYCLRKESSAGYLLCIPCFYFLSIVPARLGGGALSDLLLVYAKESGEYTSLSVSAQNIFALWGGGALFGISERGLFYAGLAAAALCAAAIAALVYSKKDLSPRGLIFISALCVLALPYLLPRMHERYFYLADLLSTLYVLYNPRSWYIAALVVGASLLAYMPYLSQVALFSWAHISLVMPSAMVLLALILLGLQFYEEVVATEPSVS